MKHPLFSPLLLAIFLSGCARHPAPPITEQTFYYWKPLLQLSVRDGEFFKKKKIQRLYVRFFDLDWDAQTRKLFPRAILHAGDLTGLPAAVVPVVFVTPKALSHLKPYGPCARLALRQIRNLGKNLGRPTFPEIQMDGDWTPSNQENYFGFLTELKKEMGKNLPAPLLSATVRLHQVKYRTLSGIPPVDRGVLMVYHSSAPQELNTKNSILDETDARAYLGNVKDYPLPLDLAFPLFRWGAQFNQNGKFLKVFRVKPDNPEIRRAFAHMGGALYRAKADVYLGDLRFMKDDYLKLEAGDPKVAERLRDWILERHPNAPQRVLWFDYSSFDMKESL